MLSIKQRSLSCLNQNKDKVTWPAHINHILVTVSIYLPSHAPAKIKQGGHFGRLFHRHSLGSSHNLPPPLKSAEAKGTFLALCLLVSLPKTIAYFTVKRMKCLQIYEHRLDLTEKHFQYESVDADASLFSLLLPSCYTINQHQLALN